MFKQLQLQAYFLITVMVVGIVSCAPQSRMGMVLDQKTGLQFGSITDKSFLIDPNQFSDKRIKLRIRNTSGDSSIDLRSLQNKLENAYQSLGYTISSGNEYGLLFDIDLRYSGQTTKSLKREFGFLGASVGGLGAYSRSRGGIETAAGVIAGAALGQIIGSYQRQNTFIVVAEVTIGLIDKNHGRSESKITFGKTGDSKSKKIKEFKGFKSMSKANVAVFAGGNNIAQRDISAQVIERFYRILRDII